MQSITAALLQKRHALLESPTGTGQMPLPLYTADNGITLHNDECTGIQKAPKLSFILHPSSHFMNLD